MLSSVGRSYVDLSHDNNKNNQSGNSGNNGNNNYILTLGSRGLPQVDLCCHQTNVILNECTYHNPIYNVFSKRSRAFVTGLSSLINTLHLIMYRSIHKYIVKDSNSYRYVLYSTGVSRAYLGLLLRTWMYLTCTI